MFVRLYSAVQSGWLDMQARWKEEKGAVATEYGLLLVLIALAIIAAATALGLAIAGVFGKASSSLSQAPVA